MMQKEDSVNPRQQYCRVNEEVVKRLKWLQLTEVTYGKKTTATTNNTNEKQMVEGNSASGRDSDPNSNGNASIDQLGEKQATAKDCIDPNSLKKYEVVQRTTYKAATKPILPLPENSDKAPLEGKGDMSEISSAPQRHISAVDICCLIHRHYTINAAETINPTTCTGEVATCNSATTTIRDTFLVVVSQYRPALDAFSLEMPAGLFDETDGTARKAAARELFEETGYVAFPEVLLWRDEEEEQKKRNSTGGELASSDKRENSTSTLFCERVPVPSPHHQRDAEHGPLSYDAGLSDDLFQLVTFEIDIHDNEEDKGDSEGSDKSDHCEYLTSNAEKEEVLRARRGEAAHKMRRINKSPVPHLDVDEDITTHLLLLRRQIIPTNTGVSTPSHQLTTTAARRLESIRRSVDSAAIVDGKLMSFVLGMDMANRWQGCC